MISGGGSDKTQKVVSAILNGTVQLTPLTTPGEKVALEITGAGGVVYGLSGVPNGTDGGGTVQIWIDGVKIYENTSLAAVAEMFADGGVLRRAFPNGLYFTSSFKFCVNLTVGGTTGGYNMYWNIGKFA